MAASLHTGSVLGKWTLGRKLGSGEFGEVYETTDSSGAVWAIKISRLERGPKEKKVKGTTQSDGAIGLAVERRVYQVQLPGLPNVPALPPQCYGDANGHRYLVMQRLGVNLKEKAAEVGGTFSPAAAALVATRLLEALEVAHRRGFVYQDLKPANIMFGVGAHVNDVYLMDWGCCRQYVDLKGNMLTAGGDTGNDLFRAIPGHGNSPPAPRDDLEALGYVIVWMLRGSLPWEGSASQAALIARKTASTTSELCAGLPSFVSDFLTKTRNLGFVHARDVDYPGLYALLRPHLPPAGKPIAWGGSKPAAAKTTTTTSGKKAVRPVSRKEPVVAPPPVVESDVADGCGAGGHVPKKPVGRRGKTVTPLPTPPPSPPPVVVEDVLPVVKGKKGGARGKAITATTVTTTATTTVAVTTTPVKPTTAFSKVTPTPTPRLTKNIEPLATSPQPTPIKKRGRAAPVKASKAVVSDADDDDDDNKEVVVPAGKRARKPAALTAVVDVASPEPSPIRVTRTARKTK